MSEDFENEEIQPDGEEEGFRKSVSLGLKPHPITREMGVVISLGNEQTWMSISEAKRFIGEVDITITTAISVGSTMNLISRMPAGGDDTKDLFIPGR